MKTKSHLIKETTQYQGTTSQIVKDIFKVIKQNITEEEQKTYYLPEELDLDKPFYDAAYGSGVSVELTIKRDTEMTEPFLVDALYVPEEEIIEIVIQLNPFEEPKSYAPLYQYLMEYVRHELEHFDQEYKGTLPDAEEGLGTMEYYSQPHEIEAQGAGLNLKAKKTRQDYKKVVGDSIELTKQRYGLSDEEGNDLYNLIVGDIEERYGKKKLNESINYTTLGKIAKLYVNKTNVEDLGEGRVQIVPAWPKDDGFGYVIIPSEPYQIKFKPGIRTVALTTARSHIAPIVNLVSRELKLYSLSWEETNMVLEYYRDFLVDKIQDTVRPPLNEHRESRENTENLVNAINNHFNPPKYKGVCEIKAYISEEYKLDPITVTIIYDKNIWEMSDTRLTGTDIRNIPTVNYRSEMDGIRVDVSEDLEKLFGIQLWNIGIGLADCESDYSLLYEHDESFTPRGHTVIDNDEFKVWAALDEKSFCEFAKETKWCETSTTYPTNDMWKRMYGAGRGGTYYFIKDKKSGALNLVADYSKIPLLREGEVRQVFNSDGIPMDRFAFFSHKPELRKLFDVKYTLHQRLRYEMPFTPEEQQEWYEENITPLSTVVYALVQGKDVEENMALLEELVGPDLTVVDGYRYRSPVGRNNGQIEIMKEGILLYMEEDNYINNILCIDEDDSWYYNRAFDDYADDYEEMDSDELNYMACWFGREVMQRVYELMETLDGPNKEACSDFDDGEFTDFFDSHFPKMWDEVTDELMNHLGYGIGESRRVQMREYLESEIIIPATPEGRGEVSIFIPYVQLLFHITNHNMQTLSPLISDDKCIGEVEGGLNDIWYDGWDWPQHTHEEMDDTMNEFLDKVDEADISRADRQAGMANFHKTMKDLNFEDINSWGAKYKFKQPWEGGNTIKVRYYNVEDDTVDLWINTPEMMYRNIPVPGIPLEELVKFTQPTLFEDEWDEKLEKYRGS